MPLISCSRSTAIKEGGNNDSSVYLDFGHFRDASPTLHFPVESTNGCTQFCEFGAHLFIHDDTLRKDAVQLGELFYHLQSLSLDDDVGFDVWFSRGWLVHHFCLFVLMVWPKLSRASESFSTLFCMLALVVVFSAQSSVNRNSLKI